MFFFFHNSICSYCALFNSLFSSLVERVCVKSLMKPLKSTLNNYLAESYLKLEKQLKVNNLSLAFVLLLQDRLRTALLAVPVW